jgi:hypothetical protein
MADLSFLSQNGSAGTATLAEKRIHTHHGADLNLMQQTVNQMIIGGRFSLALLLRKQITSR